MLYQLTHPPPITPFPTQSIEVSNKAEATSRLTLEGEAGADLMASLIELLCIEGAANAEGEALVYLDVVGELEDAAVVDLGLVGLCQRDHHKTRRADMEGDPKSPQTYLSEGSRIDPVLGRNLQANS